MTLHFPNSRLLIQNLIVRGGMSGARAMATAAQDYGLIPFETAESIKLLDCQSACRCLEAAHQILEKHFLLKNNGNKSPQVNLSRLREAFERDAQLYEQKTDSSEMNDEHLNGRKKCVRMAPAIFDLMLQQIRRYP